MNASFNPNSVNSFSDEYSDMEMPSPWTQSEFEQESGIKEATPEATVETQNTHL